GPSTSRRSAEPSPEAPRLLGCTPHRFITQPLGALTMISNITLIFARADAYTALIGGNDGEEELVICASPGQDGDVRLVLTAMSVDGGARFIEPAQSRPSHAPNIFLTRCAHLENALRSALWR